MSPRFKNIIWAMPIFDLENKQPINKAAASGGWPASGQPGGTPASRWFPTSFPTRASAYPPHRPAALSGELALLSVGEPRGQPQGGFWGVPGQTWARTGPREPGPPQVPGLAGPWGREAGAVRPWVSGLLLGLRGRGSGSALPGSGAFGVCSFTPSQGEQAAPPFPFPSAARLEPRP